MSSDYYEGIRYNSQTGCYNVGIILNRTQFWSNDSLNKARCLQLFNELSINSVLKNESLQKELYVLKENYNTLQQSYNAEKLEKEELIKIIKKLKAKNEIICTKYKYNNMKDDDNNMYFKKYDDKDKHVNRNYLSFYPTGRVIKKQIYTYNDTEKRYETIIHNNRQTLNSGNIILSVTKEQKEILGDRSLYWTFNKYNGKKVVWLYWVFGEYLSGTGSGNTNKDERGVTELFGKSYKERFDFGKIDLNSHKYYI